MTKKDQLQKKLTDSLKGQSMKMLKELWALTDKRKDDGVHTLRGFILEELETRMTETQFETWMVTA